jgi:hypothetical protein
MNNKNVGKIDPLLRVLSSFADATDDKLKTNPP